VNADIQRWIAPDLNLAEVDQTLLDEMQALDTDGYSEDVAQSDPVGAGLPTLEQIAQIEQQAHDEGHAHGLQSGHAEGLSQGREEGHAEGLASGQAEIRRLSAQIEGILDNFSRPLARLEDEVVQALGDLAVRIAGALVGRAYQADPALLAQLVDQAVASVAAHQRPLQVRLHPEDIASLTPLLTLPADCSLVADTHLGRGDLRVHAEAVRIDGSLGARLQAALHTIGQGSTRP
jgi:flagellar assembly protein FliH